MKSELSKRARVKIAKIQSTSRRKMADLEMNLETHGMSEKAMTMCEPSGVQLSKFVEFSKLLETQLDKSTEGNTGIRSNSDEPKLSKEESQETRHLKELLLLHLDLVQQQQELLNLKDRQLQQITREKEALRCRLERMERRLTMMRSNGSRGESDFQDTSPVSSPAAPSYSKPQRGMKRKSNLEQHNLAKKFAIIARSEFQRSSKQSSATTSKATRASSTATPPAPSSHRESHSDLEDSISQGSKQSQSCHKSHPSKDPKNKTTITFKAPSKRSNKGVKSRRLPKDDRIMRTDTMYFVRQQEIVPAEISPKKPTTEDEVLVPSFRIKPVPRGYTMEGTENLGDAIYLKRHQKPELEEKRRKRWDAQQIREQRALERLQRGRSGGHMRRREQEEEEFESFLPDADKVEYIEICDDIPVSAFGYPLPKLDCVDFELPWFDLNKRQREDKSRHRKKGNNC